MTRTLASLAPGRRGVLVRLIDWIASWALALVGVAWLWVDLVRR